MDNFKHVIVDPVSHIFHSLAVAFNVAFATFITGLLTWLDIIGERAGEIASLTGALLSVVLIFTTISSYKDKKAMARHEESRLIMEQEKLQLEIDELKRHKDVSKE